MICVLCMCQSPVFPFIWSCLLFIFVSHLFSFHLVSCCVLFLTFSTFSLSLTCVCISVAFIFFLSFDLASFSFPSSLFLSLLLFLPCSTCVLYLLLSVASSMSFLFLPFLLLSALPQLSLVLPIASHLFSYLSCFHHHCFTFCLTICVSSVLCKSSQGPHHFCTSLLLIILSSF